MGVNMDIRKKNVLIVGMARSGISAAKLCKDMGSEVTIYDGKTRQLLEGIILDLESKGIECICVNMPIDTINKYDFIVLSPGVPNDLDFLIRAKTLHIPIWNEIELAFRFCKSPIIGITGTNGKTTTTSLVGQILKSYNKDTKVVGNIGFPFSKEVLKTKSTSLVVAELSSFQLETIDLFKCKVSAILNFSPDHLDRHKTYENYIDAKKNIIKNADSSDICILNYDDVECRKIASDAKCEIKYFSYNHTLEEGAYLFKGNLILRVNKIKYEICSVNDLKILGFHNVENALAAIAICYYSGLPIKLIKQEITKFQGVDHRTEYVTTIDAVKYYNDSKATNPDAAIKGLTAMEWPVILIGGGMDKGNDFTDWIKSFNDNVKKLIVFGETAGQIIETANKNNFTKVVRVNDLQEAVKLSNEYAKKGDCVLLSPACASWDMFKSFEERGELFKKLVMDLKG